jgi:hypothetical protein
MDQKGRSARLRAVSGRLWGCRLRARLAVNILMK